MNYLIADFKKSIDRLSEVLKLSKDAIRRDSAIKRFEICFDLAWKSIKIIAKKQGVECNSPRSCIKTAWQLKMIGYNEQWMDMLEDRNLTAHLYDEKHADEAYAKLKNYLKLFKDLYKQIRI